MRKLYLFVPVLALLICAASCGTAAQEEPFSAAFTIRPPESLTEVYFDTSYAGETQIVRDDALDFDALRALYIGGLFGEETEHAARWNSRLQVALEGDFSAQDSQMLSELAMELTRVDGFPGLRETNAAQANVHIRFVKADKAQFRYDADADGRIRSAEITVPATYLSAQRGAAVRQYMMRCCGFTQTVQTTLDSVLAEHPAADLTQADFILLNILYGSVDPGADKTVCLAAFDGHFTDE